MAGTGGVTGQFADALNRKYDIQQQEASARSGLFGAQATGILSALPTENALRAAQANHTNQQAAQVAPLAQSSIAQGQAQIGEAGARSGLLGAQTRGVDISNSPVSESVLRALYGSFLGSGLFGGGGGLGTPAPASTPHYMDQTPILDDNTSTLAQQPTITPYSPTRQALGFSAGTSQVPGAGPSTVDTVPAMLAPKEAVLNEHAANLIGRDKIAAANAFGNMISAALGGASAAPGRGMKTDKTQAFAKGTDSVAAYYPRKKNPTMQPQKLAKGSHAVAPGKSAKTPKLDAKGLATVMQMMQGMGGQPAMPGKGMV
jgi:hypothetical protein